MDSPDAQAGEAATVLGGGIVEPGAAHTGGKRRTKRAKRQDVQCRRCTAYAEELARLSAQLDEARRQNAELTQQLRLQASPAIPGSSPVADEPPLSFGGGRPSQQQAPPVPAAAAAAKKPPAPLSVWKIGRKKDSAGPVSPSPRAALRSKAAAAADNVSAPSPRAAAARRRSLPVIKAAERPGEGDFRDTLAKETLSRLCELESSLSGGSGLDREDKEKRGSVHIVPHALRDRDVCLNMVPARRHAKGDAHAAGFGTMFAQEAKRILEYGAGIGRTADDDDEGASVSGEDVPFLGGSGSPGADGEGGGRASVCVSTSVCPTTWMLQLDGDERSFALCTRTPQNRHLYLCLSEEGRLCLTADVDRWEIAHTGVTSEPSFHIRHAATGRYLSVLPAPESVAGLPSGAGTGGCSLGVSDAAGADAVWCFALAVDGDTNVFLYHHELRGLGRERLGELKTVMPETFCAVSLMRNNTKPEATVQTLARNVIKSRAVMEWRRTAFVLILVSVVVESFDSFSDINATIEYHNHGNGRIALVSTIILLLSGLLRGYLTFYITWCDSAGKFSTWTVSDLLLILLATLPVPLADIAEAIRVVRGLLAMDDASFLILKPVRTGRMQLRSAATSMTESLPQLILQAYSFFHLEREEGANETILVLSLLMSAIAIMWAVMTYMYVIAVEKRGALLEVYDLTDKEMKRSMGQPSTVGLLHSMKGDEFAAFLQNVSRCNFGRLHFDDVQLLIDHAAALIAMWKDPFCRRHYWVKKEFFLGGVTIDFYKVMNQAVHVWDRASVAATHGATVPDPKEVVAQVLARAIVPEASGLSVMCEIANELGRDCARLELALSCMQDTREEAEAWHELQKKERREKSGVFRGHISGMSFFSTQVVFVGAVAGGRALDRHGAKYAAAIIRGQPKIRHCVLSGNRFGTADEEYEDSPLPVGHNAAVVTEETFRMLEEIGGCAVDGHFDISDFRAGFRLFPSLTHTTLEELFHSVAAARDEEGDADTTISRLEWETFAQRYPKMVLALYHRLRAGTSHILTAVVYSSRRVHFQLQAVDLRGCELTNTELWSVVRVCLVDTRRRIHFLVEDGNGAHGVDAFVQQIMEAFGGSAPGAPPPPPLSPLSSDGGGGGGGAGSGSIASRSITATSSLTVPDLIMFSCVLLDYSSKTAAEWASASPVRLTLEGGVRVPEAVWEEAEAPYRHRRTLVAVNNLLECQLHGLFVSWKGRGLHGCVGGMLEAAERLRDPAIATARAARRDSERQAVDDVSVVDVSRYKLRQCDYPTVLRLNSCLWRKGINVSCAPGMRVEWKEAVRMVRDVRTAFVRDARGEPARLDPIDLRASGVELVATELCLIAEMAEALARADVDVRVVLPVLSLVNCSLDAADTKLVVRIISLGVTYCDLSHNQFGNEDMDDLLANLPTGMSCLDLTGNRKLEKYNASVMQRVEDFRDAHPDLMLCLPQRNERAGAWSAVQRRRSQALAGDAFRDLAKDATHKPEGADEGVGGGGAGGGDGRRGADVRHSGFGHWRAAMLQMAEGTAAEPESLVTSLDTWRTPRGKLYSVETVRQIHYDCKLIAREWQDHVPLEVTTPIYLFSATLHHNFMWFLGVASSGHHCGARWELLEPSVSRRLEAACADSGGGTSPRRSGVQMQVPKEKLDELGLSHRARWVREEVSPGLAVFSCGIAKLVRYQNQAQGDAGRSPRCENVLWLSRPGRAFAVGAAASSDAHHNRLPPPGLVEYTAQHLPTQCLGGRGWRAGRTSLEAVEDPNGAYDWLVLPVLTPELCELVRRCHAVLNPLCHSRSLAQRLRKLLRDATVLEEVTLVAEGGDDLAFTDAHGEVVLAAGPPEVQHLVGRRIHYVGDRRVPRTVAEMTAQGIVARGGDALRFAHHEGHFLSLLRAVVCAGLDDAGVGGGGVGGVGGVGGGGSVSWEKLTPAEIAARVQVHLVTFVGKGGERQTRLVGATADPSHVSVATVRAPTVLGRRGDAVAAPAEWGYAPDPLEAVRDRPEVYTLQRIVDDRMEQPAAVVTATLLALFEGRGDAEATVTTGLQPLVFSSAPQAAAGGGGGSAAVFSSGDKSLQWRGQEGCDADGVWMLRSSGSDSTELGSAAVAYRRNAWMLPQVRPFALALQRAIVAVNNDEALRNAPHVDPAFAGVKYRVSEELCEGCGVGGLAVWGDFCRSHEHLGGVGVAGEGQTVYVLKGRSCRFVAPWAQQSKLLECLSGFGTVWRVTAKLNKRQRQFLSGSAAAAAAAAAAAGSHVAAGGRRAQPQPQPQVVEMTEVSPEEALLAYVEEAAREAEDEALRFALMELQRFRPVVVCRQGGAAAGAEGMKAMLEHVLASSVLMGSGGSTGGTGAEVVRQLVHLLRASAALGAEAVRLLKGCPESSDTLRSVASVYG